MSLQSWAPVVPAVTRVTTGCVTAAGATRAATVLQGKHSPALGFHYTALRGKGRFFGCSSPPSHLCKQQSTTKGTRRTQGCNLNNLQKLSPGVSPTLPIPSSPWAVHRHRRVCCACVSTAAPGEALGPSWIQGLELKDGLGWKGP